MLNYLRISIIAIPKFIALIYQHATFLAIPLKRQSKALLIHVFLWAGTVHILFHPSLTDCGSPPKPNHGTVALTSSGITTYGATASQSCNAGYILSGDTVIRCKSTGSWSASVTCSIKGMWNANEVTQIIAFPSLRYTERRRKNEKMRNFVVETVHFI